MHILVSVRLSVVLDDDDEGFESFVANPPGRHVDPKMLGRVSEYA